MTFDYYTLKKLLKDHLSLEVTEHSKGEMEISIKFGDDLITRKRWKK